MPNREGTISRHHCGGTIWHRIADHHWDLYSTGRVVPYPFESMWCISPTRTPVACQLGSLETALCLCANYGHTARVRRLLDDPRLDTADIHPAARADAYVYLEDRDALAAVLMRSAEARAYIFTLEPAFINLDLVEWAQDLCRVIETRQAAADALVAC